MTRGKKLGKAVYVLSIDKEGGKVAHVNYLPASMQVKGLDARTWASKVADVLGGKVNFWVIGVPVDLNCVFFFLLKQSGRRKRGQRARSRD